MTTPTAVVVDASVWVSRVLPHEIHHASSYAWLTAHLGRGGWIVAPALLPIEVAAAIARQSGNTLLAQRTVQDMLRLRQLRLVGVARRLATIAADFAATLRLRGADAVYVAVAYQLSIPLVTWDQEQITRASTQIVAYTP